MLQDSTSYAPDHRQEQEHSKVRLSPRSTKAEPDGSAKLPSVSVAQTNASMQTLSFEYAKTRDPAAREALIMYHQKLVNYVAARFLGSGETFEDLVQVGNIGLINALDRYDPSQEVKFSTYAMPTIVGEIKRHFRDKTWQVKVPRWLQELSVNVRKSQQTLTSRLGRPPTIKELAAEVGATEDRTLEALEISHVASTISLDTRLDSNAGEDSATLLELIGRMDAGLTDIDSYSDLRRALGCLDPREHQIIELRFFEDMSQAKIARKLNISQMHVSRLQQRALERLRNILADENNRPARTRRKIVQKRSTESPSS
jgi:RNA polymerase sigma-B factor